MKLSALEIGHLVQGKVVGDPDRVVTGVAPFEQATPTDLSFIEKSKYLKEIESSKAGILIVQKGISAPNRTLILVDRPQTAILKILQICSQKGEQEKREIHPSAILSPNVSIGKNVSIGAYAVLESGVRIEDESTIGPLCYIGKDATIGKSCTLYPQVTLREEVILHDSVVIHSGTVIGADGFGYVTENGTHLKIPQVGTVEIGSGVEIGANVTIDRATMGKTVIGPGTKIDNLVQIAHNVQVGPHCLIVAQVGIAGSSRLGSRVTLAGQVGVRDHVTIGENAIVAAQSGVINDVPPSTIVFGTPSRPIQEERKIQAILGKLPTIYSEFRKFKKRVQTNENETKND